MNGIDELLKQLRLNSQNNEKMIRDFVLVQLGQITAEVEKVLWKNSVQMHGKRMKQYLAIILNLM